MPTMNMCFSCLQIVLLVDIYLSDALEEEEEEED